MLLLGTLYMGTAHISQLLTLTSAAKVFPALLSPGLSHSLSLKDAVLNIGSAFQVPESCTTEAASTKQGVVQGLLPLLSMAAI